MAGPASACVSYFSARARPAVYAQGRRSRAFRCILSTFVCLHQCPAFLRDTTSHTLTHIGDAHNAEIPLSENATSHTLTCIPVRYFMSCLPFLPDISRSIFTNLTIPPNRHYTF